MRQWKPDAAPLETHGMNLTKHMMLAIKFRMQAQQHNYAQVMIVKRDSSKTIIEAADGYRIVALASDNFIKTMLYVSERQ